MTSFPIGTPVTTGVDGVQPLFVPDRAALLERLRLTGTAEGTGSVIDEAVRAVRGICYDRLGAARVAELRGYPAEDTPATATGLERAKAERAELLLVRATLMDELPVLFMQGSPTPAQAWNEDGLTRGLSAKDLQARAAAARGEALGLLDDLAAGAADRAGLRAAVVGPTTEPTRPGDSVGRETALWPHRWSTADHRFEEPT